MKLSKMKMAILIFIMGLLCVACMTSYAERAGFENKGVLNGHSYQVYRDQCTWQEAKEKCERMGGHLATIHSDEEQRFIEWLNDYQGILWIGLYIDDDGNWNWVTEEPVSYTHWMAGEPNNYFSQDYPFENVAAFRPEWNDFHENNIAEIYGYVCEWEDYSYNDISGMENAGVIASGDYGIYNDHTYRIVPGKYTWLEAKTACESMGGYLATVNDRKEQNFLSVLKGDNYAVWIGLCRDDHDEWNWVTGEELNYFAWADGEPNNYFSSEYPFENAAAMYTYWNDLHENNTDDITGFICEWDPFVTASESGHTEELPDTQTLLEEEIRQMAKEEVNRIQTIAGDMEEYLDSLGTTNRYDNETVEAVKLFLEMRDDVLRVEEVGSGLVCQTSGGMWIGYGIDQYEPGFTGSGSLSMEDAFQACQNGQLSPDALIDSKSVKTSDDIYLLIPDPEDWTMNAIYEFDKDLLGDFSDDPDQYLHILKGEQAREAIIDGSYTDCGLLIIAAHGIELFGRTCFDFGPVSSKAMEETIALIYFDSVLSSALPNAGDISRRTAMIIEQTIEKNKNNLGMWVFPYNNMLDFRYFGSIDYFERFIGDKTFNNTVVLLATCYSERDETISQFFLNHGADFVLAEKDRGSIYQHFSSLFAITRQYGNQSLNRTRVNGIEVVTVQGIGREPDVSLSIEDALSRLDNSAFRSSHASYLYSLYKESQTKYDAEGNDLSPQSLRTFVLSSHWTETNVAEDRGPLVPHSAGGEPHYLIGFGTLSGQVIYGNQDEIPVSDATIRIFRWANHTFSEMNDLDTFSDEKGEFTFEHLPYGIYAVEAEIDNAREWRVVEHREVQTQLIGDLAIRIGGGMASVVLKREFDPNYQDGYGYAVIGYVIDEEGKLLLDSNAAPVTFFIMEGNEYLLDPDHPEKVVLRIWILNQKRLLIEIVSPTYWESPVEYMIMDLDEQNRLTVTKSLKVNIEEAMVNCYENYKLVETIPYDPDHLNELQAFFEPETVEWMDWNTIPYFVEDYWTKEMIDYSVRYAQIKPRDESNVILAFSNEWIQQYDEMILGEDRIMEQYYQPVDVRMDKKGSEKFSFSSGEMSPVDLYIAEVRGMLPGLRLKGTRQQKDNNIWSETYVSDDGCLLTLTADAKTDRIVRIDFDDSAVIQAHFIRRLNDPALFRFSGQMQSVVDMVAATEAVNLSQEVRDKIYNQDFTVGVPVEEDEVGNQTLHNSISFDGVSIIVQKYKQVVAGEYLSSLITLEFSDNDK